MGRYSWTQTLHEVSVSVPVGKGLKGKQLDVIVTKSHIKVGVKGQEPVVEVCMFLEGGHFKAGSWLDRHIVNMRKGRGRVRWGGELGMGGTG